MSQHSKYSYHKISKVISKQFLFSISHSWHEHRNWNICGMLVNFSPERIPEQTSDTKTFLGEHHVGYLSLFCACHSPQQENVAHSTAFALNQFFQVSWLSSPYSWNRTVMQSLPTVIQTKAASHFLDKAVLTTNTCFPGISVCVMRCCCPACGQVCE